jgi:hypothetical protein
MVNSFLYTFNNDIENIWLPNNIIMICNMDDTKKSLKTCMKMNKTNKGDQTKLESQSKSS